MGLDLKLLPFDFENKFISYSHTILDCERRSNLFEIIKRLPYSLCPECFISYLGHNDDVQVECYGKTIEDKYGNALTYVFAENLVAFEDHQDVSDNHQNRAIWAYLRNLPSKTKVALFWC